MSEYQNPAPVVVGLVPVLTKTLTGLLVIRRGVAPGIGKIALPGGYLEIERWEAGLTREVFEETGIRIDPERWCCFDAASSSPNPNRVMIYGRSTTPIRIEDIPAFSENTEVQEIGVIYQTGGLQDEFAFPLHFATAIKWFNAMIEHPGPQGFVKLP